MPYQRDRLSGWPAARYPLTILYVWRFSSSRALLDHTLPVQPIYLCCHDYRVCVAKIVVLFMPLMLILILSWIRLLGLIMPWNGLSLKCFRFLWLVLYAIQLRNNTKYVERLSCRSSNSSSNSNWGCPVVNWCESFSCCNCQWSHRVALAGLPNQTNALPAQPTPLSLSHSV